MASLVGKTLTIRTGWRGWVGYLGYALSLTLLFVAFTVWQLAATLEDDQPTTEGYLLVSKPVGWANTFGLANQGIDLQLLKQLQNASFAKQVTPVKTATFQCYASASMGGDQLATALFLDAVPNQMLDDVPATFTWQQGQTEVPVVLGRELLNLYNLGFAPSQGMPLLTESAVSLVSFQLELSGNGNQQNFTARIVGFSDRINSVLVPEPFLDWANNRFGKTEPQVWNKVLLQVKDLQDPNVAAGLAQLNLTANRDLLRLSELGHQASNAGSLVGGIGLVVLVLAISQLVTSQQLALADKKAELQILKLQGYQAAPIRMEAWRPQAIILVVLTTVLVGLACWGLGFLDQFFRLDQATYYSLISCAVLSLVVVLTANWLALNKAIQSA